MIPETPQQTFIFSLPLKIDASFELPRFLDESELPKPTAGVQQAGEGKYNKTDFSHFQSGWEGSFKQARQEEETETYKSFAFKQDARRRRPAGHSLNIHPPQSDSSCPT